MTAAEQGVLLLCCRLGDSRCRPLSMAQFRDLGLRARAYGMTGDPLSEMTARDLVRIGYSTEDADRILRLLDRGSRLENYLRQGESEGIVPVTRVSPFYPRRISVMKRLSCPTVLFVKGDLSLLERPAISAVGSRKLRPENAAFAERTGRYAAQEGLALCSGGAVGADTVAQDACLGHGGSCIVVLPDVLLGRECPKGVLYVTEDGFDLPFTSYRALRRNEMIHILGQKTFAAQCTYGSGGTWQGCIENLKHGWSHLYVYDDGSEGSRALIERGATGVTDPADQKNRSLTQMFLY